MSAAACVPQRMENRAKSTDRESRLALVRRRDCVMLSRSRVRAKAGREIGNGWRSEISLYLLERIMLAEHCI
jgi:hypothetical protein